MVRSRRIRLAGALILFAPVVWSRSGPGRPEDEEAVPVQRYLRCPGNHRREEQRGQDDHGEAHSGMLPRPASRRCGRLVRRTLWRPGVPGPMADSDTGRATAAALDRQCGGRDDDKDCSANSQANPSGLIVRDHEIVIAKMCSDG
jgi:hypothetical protein